MFEKVNRSLKYDSNIFFVHKHIYMDTTTDHFTPLALRVWGNKTQKHNHVIKADELYTELFIELHDPYINMSTEITIR